MKFTVFLLGLMLFPGLVHSTVFVPFIVVPPGRRAQCYPVGESSVFQSVWNNINVLSAHESPLKPLCLSGKNVLLNCAADYFAADWEICCVCMYIFSLIYDYLF